MSWYKGSWNFAPMPEDTICIAMAENEEEAVERLTAWALEHKSAVDNPHDFELEQLSEEVIEMVADIIYYDCRHYGDCDSPEEVYLKVINPKERKAMLCKYKSERKAHKKTLKDYDAIIERSRARHSIEELDVIIQRLQRKEVN
jgi:hypothetical protein